jgi:hypothetical protein
MQLSAIYCLNFTVQFQFNPSVFSLLLVNDILYGERGSMNILTTALKKSLQELICFMTSQIHNIHIHKLKLL